MFFTFYFQADSKRRSLLSCLYRAEIYSFGVTARLGRLHVTWLLWIPPQCCSPWMWLFRTTLQVLSTAYNLCPGWSQCQYLLRLHLPVSALGIPVSPHLIVLKCRHSPFVSPDGLASRTPPPVSSKISLVGCVYVVARGRSCIFAVYCSVGKLFVRSLLPVLLHPLRRSWACL